MNEKTIHRVYWTKHAYVSGDDGDRRIPELDEAMFQDFTDLKQMLTFMEELRQRDDVEMVTSASEIAGSVGKAGVEAPPSDYNWKKRRP